MNVRAADGFGLKIGVVGETVACTCCGKVIFAAGQPVLVIRARQRTWPIALSRPDDPAQVIWQRSRN